MNWTAIIERALGPVFSIIDKAVKDQDQAELLKAQLRSQLISQQTDFVQYSRDVLVAEIQGKSWMQRTWRPGLMWLFGLIIANNYLIAPYVSAFWPGRAVFLTIPPDMWELLRLGIGGYIIGRTGEKIIPQIVSQLGEKNHGEQSRP